MNPEKQQEIYEEKYENKLGVSYEEWLANAPETEDQAYAKLQEIDDELKETEIDFHDASGRAKDELEELRDRLKLEYELIEEMFGLELED